MGSEAPTTHSSVEKSSGYISPGSDTRKSSTSSTKKRASRAGTRSVTTLSAAQLERKRANDREAQRAIRQRTKDHIDHLERTVNDLRGSQEQSEKMVHVTQQRNRDLEEENAYLRTKLNEAGFNLNLLPDSKYMSDNRSASDSALLSVPSTSPVNTIGASIARPGSTSSPSDHSQSSTSRHGSWQQGAGFVGTAMGLPNAAAVANPPNLTTTWRSHEQEPSYQQGDRVEWSGNPSGFAYSQDQQRPQYVTASAQQQSSYQASGYSGMTPQSEFPNISVSTSPSVYQVQGQPPFQQQASFQVAPMQVSSSAPDYSSPHAQMHPPPVHTTGFHSAAGDQSYAQQQAPPSSMQYRDESSNRSYPLTHYPTA